MILRQMYESIALIASEQWLGELKGMKWGDYFVEVCLGSGVVCFSWG